MTATTASRTAELMSRLPGWFVEHARVTEEKARRRREKLARRYELLCGEEARGTWSHTIVEFAKRPATSRTATASASQPVAETNLQPRQASNPSLEWQEFMTSAELRDLTGRRSLGSQADVLEAGHIPFKLLRDRLLVSRFHVREWLAGRLPSRAGEGAHLAWVN